jgi:AraC-like DNA-binding protein
MVGDKRELLSENKPLQSILRKYSLAIRLIASFIVPAVFSVVFLAVVLFAQYSAKAKEDMGRIQALYLQGIRSQAENAFTSATRLCYSLSLDQDAHEAFGASPRDMLAFSRATTQVNQLLISYPYVDSIIVCANNRVAYSAYARDSYHEPASDLLAVARSANQLRPIPRYVIKKSGDLGRVLSFVYNVSNGPDYIDSAIIVNLNVDALASDLFSSVMSPPSGRQSYAVIDKSGTIIVDSHWLSDTGIALTSDQSARIVSQGARSGAWKLDSAFGPLMLSFAKSDDGDYAAVSVIDYAAYTSGIRGIMNFSLLLCGALLVAILVGTILISSRLYMPIHGMFLHISELIPGKERPKKIGDIDYASSILAWTEEQLKVDASPANAGSRSRAVLRAALTGSFGLDTDAAKEALEGSGLSLAGNGRLVAVAGRVAKVSGSSSEETEAGEKGIGAIARLAQESVSRSFPCLASDLASDSIVLLCRFPGGKGLDLEVLASALEALASEVVHRFGRALSFGVGDPVDEAEKIRDSYLSAARRSRGRIFEGPRSIVLEDRPEAAPALDREIRHRVELIEELAVGGDRRKFEEGVRYFVSLSAGEGLDRRIEYCREVAEAVRRVGSRLSDSQPPSEVDELARELEDLCGEAEVVAWLLAQYDRTHCVFDRICNVKASDLVHSAIVYIDKNYADPLMSATLVAERLSITPQYFSRIFNEHAGSSFPEYLKSVRLEKARGVIVDGSALSLDAVCESSGFRNKAYFTTAFKQKYGVTPGKFRLSLHRSGEEAGLGG